MYILLFSSLKLGSPSSFVFLPNPSLLSKEVAVNRSEEVDTELKLPYLLSEDVVLAMTNSTRSSRKNQTNRFVLMPICMGRDFLTAQNPRRARNKKQLLWVGSDIQKGEGKKRKGVGVGELGKREDVCALFL